MAEQTGPPPARPPIGWARTPATLPRLTGDRTRLRAWRAEDRTFLDFDDAARTFIGPSLPRTDAQGFERWLQSQQRDLVERRALAWCIADPATDEPWGWISLLEMNASYQYGTAEVAYWVLSGARGKGALSEALKLVGEYAFADEDLDLHRLYAITDHRNAASQGVLRKAGYVWCGTERRAMVYEPGGPEYDLVRFELIAAGERGSPELPHRHVPNMTDGVIRLRPWRHADAERVAQACADDVSQHWLGQLPSPYTLTDAESYITSCLQTPIERGLPWCVADAQTDECLASIDLRHLPTLMGVEAGYWTHPEARGKGVMTRAMNLALRHAFTPVEANGAGVHRVQLRAAQGNAASQRVARRTGFTEVGRDRQGLALSDGTTTDAIRFDLLAHEWRDRTQLA